MSAALIGETSSINTSCGGRSSTERDPPTGLDDAAVFVDVGGERVGDGLRAALGDHPTLGVARDKQHEPDRSW